MFIPIVPEVLDMQTPRQHTVSHPVTSYTRVQRVPTAPKVLGQAFVSPLPLGPFDIDTYGPRGLCRVADLWGQNKGGRY
ncbi:hypothetical protein SKAU_G00013670 [Synaphobranchus kaupii]|uniref:Uncharacterized protein n=1 Tax=Synaphobranchus kaupii TaxID=118154 RepID=A0A9Q1GBR8_SYNKA|nr:hypothetical protein SKAU_G00013670 [Synaphobranchus kaupii]